MSGWTLSELTELELRMRRGGAVELSENPEAPRDVLFRVWLQTQRREDTEPEKLVTSLLHAERLLAAALFCLAFLSGAGAVKTLLWYDGSRLINVSTFLLTMVFGQVGLLLLLFVSRLLFRSSLADLYQRLLRRAPELMESRRLRSLWSLHGFVRLQAFALAFNFGALLGTAVEGLTRDLSFGWGTTLRVGAEDIHGLLTLLARPWGGGFVPMPAEIEASRIVLIQGLGRVDPVSAAAWWPFLLLCLLAYGLLPRLLLWGTALLLLRRRLSPPDFTDRHSEQLHLRLTRPPLRFAHEASAVESSPSESAPPLPPLRPSGPVLLLADAEIGPSSALVPQVEEALGLEIPARVTQAEDVLPPLPSGGLLWLVEAWQPPLEEHLKTLRTLRGRVGDGGVVLVVLLGLPDVSGRVAAPSPGDTKLWQSHLSTLRDPALGMIAWKDSPREP